MQLSFDNRRFCFVQGLISEMLEQIARRTEQIQMTKREMERIEDGVFALFCLRVGVKNIRFIVYQYYVL